MSIKSCTVCEKTATRICGGCKEERYCSVGCQKTAWKTHKAACLEKIRVREGKNAQNTVRQAASTQYLPVTILGMQVKLEVDQTPISRPGDGSFARLVAEEVAKSILSKERNDS